MDLEKVDCPLCGGQCTKKTLEYVNYTQYTCFDCGFQSDTEFPDQYTRLAFLPSGMNGFIKRAKVDGMGELVWWPLSVSHGWSIIQPISVGNRLRWRRKELPDGVVRYPQDNAICADYSSFKTAYNATVAQNRIHSVMQKLPRKLNVERLTPIQKIVTR